MSRVRGHGGAIVAVGVVLAAVSLGGRAALAGEDFARIDWIDWSEDRDSLAMFGPEAADVADSHPLVRGAIAANPDQDVVVCMAGCAAGAGKAVSVLRPRRTASAALEASPAAALVATAPVPVVTPEDTVRPAASPGQFAWASPAVAAVLATWRGGAITVAGLARTGAR